MDDYHGFYKSIIWYNFLILKNTSVRYKWVNKEREEVVNWFSADNKIFRFYCMIADIDANYFLSKIEKYKNRAIKINKLLSDVLSLKKHQGEYLKNVFLLKKDRRKFEPINILSLVTAEQLSDIYERFCEVQRNGGIIV
jgi:hypothetical protein